MIDASSIVHTSAQLTARIPLTGPRAEIRHVMGPGLAELMAAVAAQGITPAGPWFTHHLRMDPNVFDFEICVPVPFFITPSGRVQPGSARNERRRCRRGRANGSPRGRIRLCPRHADRAGTRTHSIDADGLAAIGPRAGPSAHVRGDGGPARSRPAGCRC